MERINQNLIDALCNVIYSEGEGNFGSANPNDGIVLKRELALCPPSAIIQAVRERLGLQNQELAGQGLNVNLLGIDDAEYIAKSSGIQLSTDQMVVKVAPVKFVEGLMDLSVSPIATQVRPATFAFDDEGQIDEDVKTMTLMSEAGPKMKNLRGLGWFLRFKPYKTTRGLATLKITMNSTVPYEVDILVDEQSSGTIAFLGLDQMAKMKVRNEIKDDKANFNYETSEAASYAQISTRLQPATIAGQNVTVWAYPIIPDVAVVNGIACLSAFGKLGKLVNLLAYLY